MTLIERGMPTWTMNASSIPYWKYLWNSLSQVVVRDHVHYLMHVWFASRNLLATILFHACNGNGNTIGALVHLRLGFKALHHHFTCNQLCFNANSASNYGPFLHFFLACTSRFMYLGWCSGKMEAHYKFNTPHPMNRGTSCIAIVD